MKCYKPRVFPVVLRGDCDYITDCLVEAIDAIPLARLERVNRAEEDWEVECWDDRPHQLIQQRFGSPPYQGGFRGIEPQGTIAERC